MDHASHAATCIFFSFARFTNHRVPLPLVSCSITLVAGSTAGTMDGSLSSAQFNQPNGLCAGPSPRSYYVADSNNNAIRLVDMVARTVTRVVGNGGSGSNQPVTVPLDNQVFLSQPHDCSYWPATRKLVIADTGNQQIRLVDFSAGTVTRIAGGGSGSSADGILATNAYVSSARRLAWDVRNSLQPRVLYSEYGSPYRMRYIDTTTGVVNTFAGLQSFSGTFAGDGGSASQARLVEPLFMAVDQVHDAVYFSDGSRVRTVSYDACNRLRADAVTAIVAAPAVQNVTMTMSTNVWPVPSGVTADCLFRNTSAVSREQQALRAGYRFGVAYNDSGRFVRNPCVAISFFLDASTIPTPNCQQRARLICTLAASLDGGDWQAYAALVPARNASVAVPVAEPLDTRSIRFQQWQDGGIVLTAPAPTVTTARLVAFTDRLARIALTGTGFAPELARAVDPLAMTLARGGCGNITGTATVLTADCNITGPLWYLPSVGGVLRVANRNVSFTVALPRAPPLTVTPSVARWGERLDIVGREIALAVTETVWLQPKAAAAVLAACPACAQPVPCVAPSAVGADQVSCTLRFMHEALIGQPLLLNISFSGDPGALPAGTLAQRSYSNAEAGFLIGRPRMSSLIAPLFLARAGGDILTFALPALRLKQVDFAAAGAAQYYGIWWEGVRAWVGGAPASGCHYTSDGAVECLAPAGTEPYARATLEIGSSFNITNDDRAPGASLLMPQANASAPPPALFTAYLTYEPPAIGAVVPSAVYVAPLVPAPPQQRPPTQAPASLSVSLSSAALLDAVSRGFIVALSVGSAPCGSVSTSLPSTVVCSGVNASLLLSPTERADAALLAAAAVTLPVSFQWAGRTVGRTTGPSGSCAATGASTASVQGVVRPILTAVTPAVFAESAVSVYGSGICPPAVCSGASDLRILIGGVECTAVRDADATSATCTAPELSADIVTTFPQAAVVVINAAGAASTEEVFVVYPSGLSVAWRSGSSSSGSSSSGSVGGSSSASLAAVSAWAPPSWTGEITPELPLLPAPTLFVNGSAAACSLAVIESACSLRTAAERASRGLSPWGIATTVAATAQGSRVPAVVGSGTQFTAIPPGNGTFAVEQLTGLGISAPMNCTLSVQGRCRPAVSGADARVARTPEPLHVATPILLGNWSTFLYTAVSSTGRSVYPSSPLLANAVALLTWEAAWPPAAAGNSSSASASASSAGSASSWGPYPLTDGMISCSARIAPAAATFDVSLGVASIPFASAVALSAGQLLSPAAAAALSPDLSVSFAHASGPGSGQSRIFGAVRFPDLVLDRAQLGAAYSAYAECVWSATGERLLLPPVHVRLLEATVRLAPAPPAPGMPAPALMELLPSRSKPVAADVVVAGGSAGSGGGATGATLFAGSDGACTWRQLRDAAASASSGAGNSSSSSTASTGSGTLRLSAESASAVYAVLPSGALSPTPQLMMDGPVNGTAVVVLTCTLWQRVTTSAPMSVRAVTLALRVVAETATGLAFYSAEEAAAALLLPLSFLPSDSTVRTPLTPHLNVSLLDGAALVTGVECKLSALSGNVAVRRDEDATSGFVVTATSDASGIVRFGAVVLIASFSASSVTLSVSCTRAGLQDDATMQWALAAVPVAAAICTQPPAAWDSQSKMPPWSVAIGVLPPEALLLSSGSNGSASASASAGLLPDGSPAAEWRTAWPSPDQMRFAAWLCNGPAAASYATASSSSSNGRFVRALPVGTSSTQFSCTVEADPDAAAPVVSANGTARPAQMFLQDAAVSPSVDGNATFTSLTLSGEVGVSYPLRVVCRLGSVPIPSPGHFAVTVRGCPPGYEFFDLFCRACPEGQFSLGGVDTACHRCPRRGALCTATAGGGSLLTLLPDFYRPPSEQGLSVSESSIFLPCVHAEACRLDNATAIVPTYRCEEGYVGALCGSCKPGWAKFGKACTECWSPGLSRLLLTAVIFAVLGLMVWVATRKGASERSLAAILFRILLTYTQALGAIRAFRAGGTSYFREAFGWTEVVAASPFSAGPIRCATEASWFASFLSIVLSPFIAAGGVMAAFVLLSLFSRTDWQRVLAAVKRCASSCACSASCRRRLLAGASPFADSNAAAARARPRTSDAGLAIGISAGLRISSDRPGFETFGHHRPGTIDWRGWRQDIAQWWEDRRGASVFVFILSIAYMPIVSSAISALDCYETPIDGVTYLRADLSVPCYKGQHAIARIIAIATLLFIGAGFPAMLFVRTFRATAAHMARGTFRAVWLTLVDGYRTNFSVAEVQQAPVVSNEQGAPSKGPAAPAGAASARSAAGPPLIVSLRTASTGGFEAISHLRSHSGGAEQAATAGAPGSSAARSGAASLRIVSSNYEADAEVPPLLKRCLMRTRRRLGCDKRSPVVVEGGKVGCAARSRTCRALRTVLPCFSCCCDERCTLRHLMWWDAVTLARKAFIVVLASLLTDATLQLCGFALLMLAAAVAQLMLQPYTSRLLNALELASILVVLLTSLFSFLLVGASEPLTPGSAATGSSGADAVSASASGLESKTAVVTVILIALNGTMLAVLAALYAWYQVLACCRSATVKSARTAIRRRSGVAGMSTGLGRASIFAAPSRKVRDPALPAVPAPSGGALIGLPASPAALELSRRQAPDAKASAIPVSGSVAESAAFPDAKACAVASPIGADQQRVFNPMLRAEVEPATSHSSTVSETIGPADDMALHSSIAAGNQSATVTSDGLSPTDSGAVAPTSSLDLRADIAAPPAAGVLNGHSDRVDSCSGGASGGGSGGVTPRGSSTSMAARAALAARRGTGDRASSTALPAQAAPRRVMIAPSAAESRSSGQFASPLPSSADLDDQAATAVSRASLGNTAISASVFTPSPPTSAPVPPAPLPAPPPRRAPATF